MSKEIRAAFYEAQELRPYSRDVEIIRAVMPAGGDWQCDAHEGAITRTITWAGKEVAQINPRGDLDDQTEGQIAMAIRAMPLMDAALRTIMALADHDGNTLIRKIAESVIAYVEMDAPKLPIADEDDPDFSEVDDE